MRPPAAGLGPTCDAAPASESTPPTRSPRKFFLLVFALSNPFWLMGGVTDLQLMPGLSVDIAAKTGPATHRSA